MKGRKFIYGILNIDIAIGVFCMFVLVGITAVGVIMRYLFNRPLIGQEEIQNWMIIWSIFCGGSFAFRKGLHIAVDFLVTKFPQKIQYVLEWFSYFCTLGVLIFITYHSYQLNLQFFNMGRSTPMHNIPNYIVFGIVTVGSVWMILSATVYMLERHVLERKKEVTL